METKVCTKCKVEKPLSEFYNRAKGKLKKSSDCKKCRYTINEIWRANNKERHKKLQKLWVKNNKKRVLENQRNWFKNNPGKMYTKGRKRLCKKVGLTLEQYEIIVKAQNNKCLICGCEEESKNKKLVVDHDHNTGLFRGLLCSKCNAGLGCFRDNPEILENAINYLKRYEESEDGRQKRI